VSARALFVSLDEPTVLARCDKADVSISTIEKLPQGGVRFVCTSVDGATVMKKKLKSHLLPDTVARQAYRPAAPTW
jgi:DNA polymerase II large subunit